MNKPNVIAYLLLIVASLVQSYFHFQLLVDGTSKHESVSLFLIGFRLIVGIGLIIYGFSFLGRKLLFG